MPLAAYARDLIANSFPNQACLMELFQRVFNSKKYERSAALKLLGAARGKSGEAWEVRCAAVLLLEHSLLKLSPKNLHEHKILFDKLGISLGCGRAGVELLKQGYTLTTLEGFVTQLRRRLARLQYLHKAVMEPDPGREDWENFLALSRQESRLTLARYCFTPQQIAARILEHVEVSQGVKNLRDCDRRWFNPFTERMWKELPALEAAIASELTSDNKLYWLTDKTSSELCSLIEFPLTSAVLTVKPPGSHIEFEIKRAGVPGNRRLNVITRRNGVMIPLSHQLQGGSFGWLGRREAEAASLFAYIFRLVHGKCAPLCLTLSITSLLTVPAVNGKAHILDYLTSEDTFGEGFEEMRAAMRECIGNLPPDCGVPIHPYPGPMGLTLQFLAQAQPQQAFLLNTTSFRLDRLALYLSADGPEEYFTRGLRKPYTQADARGLADVVLTEILGVCTRPASAWTDYRSYVLDALAANRAAADSHYLNCMQQVGEFWGTLLGVRGYSDGESFVARNVGLRSVWEAGEWRVRVIFMDHDDLFVLEKRKRYFWPYRAIAGMYRDEVHVMGRDLEGNKIKGDRDHLRQIYHVNDAIAQRGEKLLEASARKAYDKTLRALETDRRLQNLFLPEFIAYLRDWDIIVRMYLESVAGGGFWKPRALAYLKSRSYEAKRVRNYINSIEEFCDFLYRMAFLYESR
jgi:hypothetical protein